MGGRTLVEEVEVAGLRLTLGAVQWIGLFSGAGLLPTGTAWPTLPGTHHSACQWLPLPVPLCHREPDPEPGPGPAQHREAKSGRESHVLCPGASTPPLPALHASLAHTAHPEWPGQGCSRIPRRHSCSSHDRAPRDPSVFCATAPCVAFCVVAHDFPFSFFDFVFFCFDDIRSRRSLAGLICWPEYEENHLLQATIRSPPSEFPLQRRDHDVHIALQGQGRRRRGLVVWRPVGELVAHCRGLPCVTLCTLRRLNTDNVKQKDILS